MTLYEMAVKALPADHIDHHCSDLYIKATPEAEAVLREWISSNHFENAASSPMMLNRFYSHLDGCLWYDIAFQYAPYWEACFARHAQ